MSSPSRGGLALPLSSLNYSRREMKLTDIPDRSLISLCSLYVSCGMDPG